MGWGTAAATSPAGGGAVAAVGGRGGAPTGCTQDRLRPGHGSDRHQRPIGERGLVHRPLHHHGRGAHGQGGRRGRGGDLLHRFGRPASGGRRESRSCSTSTTRSSSCGGRHHALRVQQRQWPAGRRSLQRGRVHIPFTEDAGRGRPPAQPELAWTWDGGEERIFNGHISGVQRLRNGNTLVVSARRAASSRSPRTTGWSGSTFRTSSRTRAPTGMDRRPRRPAQGRPGRRSSGWWPSPGRAPAAAGPRAHAIFRASRYEADHPGLARVGRLARRTAEGRGRARPGSQMAGLRRGHGPPASAHGVRSGARRGRDPASCR